MKKFSIFSLLVFVFISACGSGNMGEAVFEGPELSLAEAQQLEVNHIYVKDHTGGGLTTKFTVYLKDEIFGNYLVCAGPDQGLDVVSQAGVYYGNLSVPMVPVTGAKDNNAIRFGVVITSDQDEECPSLPDENKIVAATTSSFTGLIDTPVAFENDEAIVTLKGRGHENVNIESLPKDEEGNLTVGEIYFTQPYVGDEIPEYYITLFFVGSGGYRMIDYTEMPELRENDVVYSWLNLSFADIEDSDLKKSVWLTFNRLGSESVDIIGETEIMPLEDLFGNKVEFKNNKGYIEFRDIN